MLDKTLIGNAQVVLKICSIVCQKLYGSRDLGHAHFQGNYLCASSALPIQSDIPNLKSLAQIICEILRSKRIGVTEFDLSRSRDVIGHVTIR